MKKTCLLTVQGKNLRWSFRVELDPRDIPEYESDGLEILQPYYIVPEWIINAGLMRPFMFLQDLFYLRNPFSK